MADAIVVGGGVVGCAVAWSLAREGVTVALLERGDELALHASGAAAGMLQPTGEARRRGPFLSWARRSLALFPELVEELRDRSGVDPELELCGALHAAFSEEGLRGLRARAGALAAADSVWLAPEAARAAEPQLAPELRGALWVPGEGHVRSPLLTRAFADAASQLGARIERGAPVVGLCREGVRVTGVRTPAGDRCAGIVVLCMGAWTSTCAAWLGTRASLPIEPVRGQIVSLDAPAPPLRSVVVGEGSYLVPRRDGTVVLGATVERVGFDCRVTADGVGRLLDAAPRLVPALAECGFRSAWAGLRPATPDDLPLIGPLPGLEGLLVAAGHFRNGVLLAPITGRLIADFVTGKELPESAAAFRPDRFV